MRNRKFFVKTEDSFTKEMENQCDSDICMSAVRENAGSIEIPEGRMLSVRCTDEAYGYFLY